MPGIPQLFDLGGRVAFVTGARGYLGRATVRRAGRGRGARRRVEPQYRGARSRAAELGGREAGRHLAVCLDQLDEESIEQGFEDAVAQAGQVDILVNNGHDPLAADWTTVTAEQFQRQLTNLTGYFLLARRLRDHAVARQSPASVILLGSMYGLVGSYPDAYEGICAASPVAYHALKGGIVHLTRHLAVYWAKDGVRVNCLSPGPFPSPQAPPALVERLKTKSPLRRMGAPHELKGAIVFLASDASSYMTGQNLVIDGGWTAW